MLEYRVHVAALHAFRDGLAAQGFADPVVAQARDRDVDDLAAYPAHAFLGSSLDQLAWFAVLGEEELDVLNEAAGLWTKGRALYDALDSFRITLQRALADPTETSKVTALNSAGETLRVLAPAVQTHIEQLAQLRRRVAKRKHLPEHPRQQDTPIEGWNWSDLLLARRTDALVRTLLENAPSPHTRAFALGALAGYGANVSGSAYLSQTVGGPRRSHRVRDRLARNSVGAWIGVNHPGVASIAELGDLLDDDMPGGLDPQVDALLTSSIAAVYPTDRLRAVPDFGLGFGRMRTHLRLLAILQQAPPPPSPLPDSIVGTVFGDPATPYVPTLTEQATLTESGGQPGVAGSGAGVQILSAGDDGPTHQEEPDSTEVKCGSFWEALGLSLLFLLGGWFACVVRWSGGDRCPLWDDMTQNWEAAFDNGVYVGGEHDTDWPGQALTVDDMGQLVQLPELTQLVGDLFTLQSAMWEGFGKAADFLAVNGLIYPDEFLGRWRYKQFTVVPSHDEAWPQLPYSGPRFDKHPNTGAEEPTEDQPFRPGASPAAILTGIAGGGQLSANSVSLPIWSQVTEGTLDAENLDLDSDRGWRHPCWRPDVSIADQPLGVVTLDYQDI
jgi:hypothetical protein